MGIRRRRGTEIAAEDAVAVRVRGVAALPPPPWVSRTANVGAVSGLVFRVTVEWEEEEDETGESAEFWGPIGVEEVGVGIRALALAETVNNIFILIVCTET